LFQASNLVQPADRNRYYLLFAAVVIFLILPLWPVPILPWTDLGDHMARMYILHHYDDVPVFRQYYEIERLPLPNLAMDLIVPPMLGFMSAYVAAKVFASLSVILFAVACHVFGRTVHGVPTWLAIPAAFFFYNSLTLTGFLNYMWSVAWFLLAAAAWLVFDRKHSLISGVLATAAAFLTYIAHLSGFFFLCMFVGLMTIFAILRGVNPRRVTIWNAIAFLPLLPGLAAYATLGSAKGDTQRTEWSSVVTKLAHSGILFAGYSLWMDAIVIAGLAAVLVAAVRFGKWGGDRALLSTGALFLLAFCVFPYRYHTGVDADTRFIVPGALLLALSVTINITRPVTMWGSARWSFILLLTAFAIRIVLMEGYWLRADRILTEQAALLRQVDEQSRIHPMVFLPRDRTEFKLRGALTHLAGYTVIERHAISGSTFAVPGQQPLQHRIPLPYAEVGPWSTIDTVSWKQVFDDYDYIWIYDGPAEFLNFLDQHAQLRARAGEGRLYRVYSGRL
jgi:hypothetical protein